MNTLADNIINFVQILRGLGVRVSVAEALDAAESLNAINVLERGQFKAALKSTLIKNAQDRDNFEKAFRLFFVSAEEKQQRELDWNEKQETDRNATLQAESELVFQGRALDIPSSLKDVYKRISADEKRRMQEFLEKTSAGNKVDEKFQPMLENIIRKQLSFWHRQLSPEDQELLRQAQRDLLGKSELDNIISTAQSEAGDTDSGQNPLLGKNMRDIEENEIPAVTALIKRLSHKLSSRISRRFRLTAKKDAIDIRRTIRRNMRYGGTMLALKYKSKKIKKPNIVILCDVSASMSRYVRFTLPLLYGISSVVKNIESFIFANELEKATAYFQRGEDFSKTVQNLLDNSTQMGKGTNIFLSLEKLRNDYAECLSKSTLLFIISDANTLFPKETVRELKVVGERVKKIIWLNTQPENVWTQNAAIGDFRKHSSMFECCTLSHLAKVLSSNLTLERGK